ncbi:hypothetical protein [Roseobacter fucihabitans]|uniref:hypothetical protein n=1 Tax=Roseobacter fucihabitans TaxID=1537242 RepID=UPI00165320B7|nr:hypothetical protein [Roseobacter litoralis]
MEIKHLMPLPRHFLSASLLLSAAFLAACETSGPSTSRLGGPVPFTEAAGVFDFICGEKHPESRLIYPFRLVDTESKTYRHVGGFDMAFRVDRGCSMRVRVDEVRSKNDDLETAVLKASTFTFPERMASSMPKAIVRDDGDGYFLVALP